MKIREELERFYQSVLQPELKILEAKRKKLLRQAVFIISGGLLVSLFLLLFSGFRQTFFLWLVPGMIVGISFIFLQQNFSAFREEFKQKVIKPLVNLLGPSFQYFPDRGIPLSVFQDSRIFLQPVDLYQSEDLITGCWGQTNFSLSEVKAQQKVTVRTRHGSFTYYQTFFQGLFFLADFNKSFSGLTIVLPDTGERVFGHLAQTVQSWNIFRGQLIKMEDPEFEKEFVVYGSDQVEARYILSTSLMARILNFKRQTGRQIYLSFVHSTLRLAISREKGFLEPRFFSSLLDFTSIYQYYQDICLCTEIVDALNLNIRIWQTKENAQKI